MAVRGAIVVTGASSGIGLATTLALARHGWLVFGGVRTTAAAARLEADAGALGVGALVLPLTLDVAEEASIARAHATVVEALRRRGLPLVGLVNNAGVGAAGPLEELPIARLRDVLEVNAIGVVAATQAFLPLLRAGRGRIVNVSSVSGRVAAPFLGPYAASKFALEGLSDALRVELRPWNLPVILIEPGPVATPIWRKGEQAAEQDRAALSSESPYAPYLPLARAETRRAEARGVPPEVIARAIVGALRARHPRTRYLLTAHPFIFAGFARLVPDRLRDRLMALPARRPGNRTETRARESEERKS